MDMHINKRYFLLFFCLCMISCNNDKKLCSRIISVTDNKPYADSLYENNESSYNARKIDFLYVVKNNTGKKIYLPIHTSYNDKLHSYVSAQLINGKDTITPLYSIDKVPYKSDIINAGDSMLIFVRLYQFYRWQTQWCNVNTDIRDILSMIRLNYHKSQADINKELKNVDLEFETDYQKIIFYEIQPGTNTDEL